jgi:hypothetical protein
VNQLDVIVLGDLDERLADLGGEVLRAKASLLYGDRVTVSSHKIIFLLSRMAARTRMISRSALDEGVMTAELGGKIADELEARGLYGVDRNSKFILESLRGDNPEAVLFAPEAIAEIMRDRQITPGQPTVGLFRAIGPIAVTNYLRSHPELDQAQVMAHANDLAQLSETGLVHIESGPADQINVVDFDQIEEAVAASIDRAVELLTTPGGSEHPLFTRNTRLALQDLRRRESLRGADFTRANRVEIAARLIADIPSFPFASIDEIVDIRRRVEPHLKRFRAAIADLEEALDTDVLADDFNSAVDEIKLREVEPALEELRESLWDEGLKPTAARSVPYLASGALGLGAAWAMGAPDLAGVAAVTAGASTAAASEFVQRHTRDGERARNRLFLLFEVERQLESRLQ